MFSDFLQAFEQEQPFAIEEIFFIKDNHQFSVGNILPIMFILGMSFSQKKVLAMAKGVPKWLNGKSRKVDVPRFPVPHKLFLLFGIQLPK